MGGQDGRSEVLFLLKEEVAGPVWGWGWRRGGVCFGPVKVQAPTASEQRHLIGSAASMGARKRKPRVPGSTWQWGHLAWH